MIAGIYDFVKSKVKWNGVYSKYAFSNLKKVFEDGEGNVAEVNLMLANMLLRADIKASPVLLSTRNHGFVRPELPISSQFNYVIVEVEVDGKTILLDATDRVLPIHLLPQRALNQQGLRVSKDNPGWVKLASSGFENTMTVVELDLNKNGLLEGNALVRYSDYAARTMRSKISREEDDFKEKIAQKINGSSIV